MVGLELVKKVDALIKSPIKKIIDNRLSDFKKIRKSDDSVFKELCFCILTANSSAERCIEVQNKAGNAFSNLSESKLSEKLKSCSCRFYNKRANYIVEARKLRKELFGNLKTMKELELRDWLAENIKGLGMKEASHFMRNIGYENVAIIDFHIVDLLVGHKLIKVQKKSSISRSNYLEIENVLRTIANKLSLNLAELDLYLWYLETGKILK